MYIKHLKVAVGGWGGEGGGGQRAEDMKGWDNAAGLACMGE